MNATRLACSTAVAPPRPMAPRDVAAAGQASASCGGALSRADVTTGGHTFKVQHQAAAAALATRDLRVSTCQPGPLASTSVALTALQTHSSRHPLHMRVFIAVRGCMGGVFAQRYSLCLISGYAPPGNPQPRCACNGTWISTRSWLICKREDANARRRSAVSRCSRTPATRAAARLLVAARELCKHPPSNVQLLGSSCKYHRGGVPCMRWPLTVDCCMAVQCRRQCSAL